MAEIRYLGMVVGEGGAGSTDPRLGRFVTMTEPMPVGTAVELEGATHRVTRVEEGATSGAWLWPDGAARAPIDDGPTVPERVISIEAEPTSAASSAAIRAIPFDLLPEREAPAAAISESVPETVPEASPSSPNSDEPGPGGKKRRRRPKTVMGR